MNEDLVSIYLPTYNRCDLLRRAVYSVLSQTYLDWELIIVDDRSTDGTRDFLGALQRVDPRVKCVFKSDTGAKSGVQVSRNIAINLAEGQYVTGLDDDDYFHPARIARLKSAYHSDLAFVSSNYLRLENGQSITNSKVGRRITLQNLAIRNSAGNQVFTEKKKLIAAGLFDEEMISSQDLDLWIRLVKIYGPATRIVDHLYYYDAEHQQDRVSAEVKRAAGDKQLIEKHEGVFFGQTKRFKIDMMSESGFGMPSGILQSFRKYGLAITTEILRTKYGYG